MADLSILLIEDDVFTRMVIARMLASLGIGVVHQAADGEEGLQELDRTRPDLVLCDVEMRPMDGMHFLARVRETADHRDLPVVLMSNHCGQTRQAEARRLKAASLIQKPVEIDSLRSILRLASGRRVSG